MYIKVYVNIPDTLPAPGHGAGAAAGGGWRPVRLAAAPSCQLPAVGPAGGVGQAAAGLLGGRADGRAGGVRLAQY